jgi:putative oxidoreductase
MGNFKMCLKTASHDKCGTWAILVLRVIMGVAFLHHGWGKIQNPFAWMPPQAPVPGFLQFLAAVAEFGGGISLVIGLLTPIFAIGLAITMAVAVCMHALMLGDPFVNPTGGSSYELALVYFGVSLLILAMGPGKFSADAKVFGTKA